MGKLSTVFQAEVNYAIELCAGENISKTTSDNFRSRTVIILSDSQAAPKALELIEITSKLVKEMIGLLNSIGKAAKLQ